MFPTRPYCIIVEKIQVVEGIGLHVLYFTSNTILTLREEKKHITSSREDLQSFNLELLEDA